MKMKDTGYSLGLLRAHGASNEINAGDYCYCPDYGNPCWTVEFDPDTGIAYSFAISGNYGST